MLPTRLALLLAMAVGALGARAAPPPAGAKSGAASALAAQIAADRLWAGIAIVTEGGKVLLEEAHGLGLPELGVPLKPEHIAPIGSNTKLFTAVAIWQLHEQGKLDATQPFTRYVNMSALGLPADWCPRLADNKGRPTGSCLPAPTLEQLLRMSGGIVDASNCEYAAGDWEVQYCLQNSTTCLPGNAPPAFFATVYGAADPAAVLRGTGVLLAPFEFAPGAKYHYSNEAYILASHVVEHVSRMPLAAYFQEHMFDPLGLASTFMDVSNGQDGAYINTLPYPGYVAYMAPLELGMPALDKSYLGKLTYTAGTLDVVSLAAPAARTAAGGGVAPPAAPGRWAKTGRASAPIFGGNDFAFATGAGAIRSSVRDVAKWLRALTTEPQRLSLSPATLARMLGASAGAATPMPPPKNSSAISAQAAALGPRVQFAQGVVVLRDSSKDKGKTGGGTGPGRLGGVTALYYRGSLGGFDATYYLVLDPSDASKDVFTFVLTTTDTAWSPYAPYLSTSGPKDSACTFEGRAGSGGGGKTGRAPLPSYMCRGKDPKAQVLDAYLHDFTGKGLWGL